MIGNCKHILSHINILCATFFASENLIPKWATSWSWFCLSAFLDQPYYKHIYFIYFPYFCADSEILYEQALYWQGMPERFFMDTEFGSKEMSYDWARTAHGLSQAGNWDRLKAVSTMDQYYSPNQAPFGFYFEICQYRLIQNKLNFSKWVLQFLPSKSIWKRAINLLKGIDLDILIACYFFIWEFNRKELRGNIHSISCLFIKKMSFHYWNRGKIPILYFYLEGKMNKMWRV